MPAFVLKRKILEITRKSLIDEPSGTENTYPKIFLNVERLTGTILRADDIDNRRRFLEVPVPAEGSISQNEPGPIRLIYRDYDAHRVGDKFDIVIHLNKNDFREFDKEWEHETPPFRLAEYVPSAEEVRKAKAAAVPKAVPSLQSTEAFPGLPSAKKPN